MVPMLPSRLRRAWPGSPTSSSPPLGHRFLDYQGAELPGEPQAGDPRSFDHRETTANLDHVSARAPTNVFCSPREGSCGRSLRPPKFEAEPQGAWERAGTVVLNTGWQPSWVRGCFANPLVIAEMPPFRFLSAWRCFAAASPRRGRRERSRRANDPVLVIEPRRFEVNRRVVRGAMRHLPDSAVGHFQFNFVVGYADDRSFGLYAGRHFDGELGPHLDWTGHASRDRRDFL